MFTVCHEDRSRMRRVRPAAESAATVAASVVPTKLLRVTGCIGETNIKTRESGSLNRDACSPRASHFAAGPHDFRSINSTPTTILAAMSGMPSRT